MACSIELRQSESGPVRGGDREFDGALQREEADLLDGRNDVDFSAPSHTSSCWETVANMMARLVCVK
jgi:hypothetical protein